MALPAYLSKGLEFDAVIVTCIEDDYACSNLDIKLLYVAITRALHKMDIIRLPEKNEVDPLIAGGFIFFLTYTINYSNIHYML